MLYHDLGDGHGIAVCHGVLRCIAMFISVLMIVGGGSDDKYNNQI